jgi:chromosome segregation ATPase
MSTANLVKIKDKLNAMRDAVEVAEDRESDAKNNLRLANERAAKAEEDADSYKRRLELLRKELDKNLDKVQENKDSLTNLHDKIEQEQATEKELGGLELDTDEQLNDIEVKAKDALTRQDEKLRDLNDISRKLTKTELDLSRSTDRVDKAEARITEMNHELKNAGDSMSKLESKDEEASEREGVQEEKIEFLQGELKVLVERFEVSDRDGRKLERTLDELSMDLENFKEKKAKVDNEFNEISNAVDDV